MTPVRPLHGRSHPIADPTMEEVGREATGDEYPAWYAISPPSNDDEPEFPLEAISTRSADVDDEDEAPRPPESPRRGLHPRLPRAGKAMAIAATCLGLMAALGERQTIVRTLPDTAPIYAMIGLPVNVRELAIRNVKGTLVEEGSRHVLAVLGEIANLRAAAQEVPEMRIALRGPDGREMYTWTARAPKSKLNAGETVVFRTRLAAPPEGIRDILVRFAEARSGNGSEKAAK
ncbi:MAG: hypothetical protein JOY94_17370 [Methylobacteriaceae bacterium]|nr:hypothetical protein [Methylobacteriaceae bacterium]